MRNEEELGMDYRRWMCDCESVSDVWCRGGGGGGGEVWCDVLGQACPSPARSVQWRMAKNQ